MNHWSPAFEAYVDRAKAGNLGLWRFGLGLLFIVGASIAAFILIFIFWSVVLALAAVAETGVPPSEAELESGIQSMLSGRSPAEVTLLLLAWSGMWIGVWLAVRLLQRRRLGTLIAARPRLYWPDFLRAAIATAIGGGVVVVISLIVGSDVVSRSSLDFGSWVWWLLPVAAATLVQTSAEEIVFRGYITQTLAARFRSPLIWAVVPIALFCGIHFSSSFSGPTNFTVVVFAAVFGSVATFLVWHTGNLGAAMGMHFLNNLMAFTLTGGADFFGGEALFTASPILGWSEALFGLASGILPLGIAMLLLFEPRSPLRLRSLDAFSSPSATASVAE